MKQIFAGLTILFLLLSLTACQDNGQPEPTVNDEVTQPIEQPKDGATLDYVLLMHLDFMPHEVGNSMTLIQDNQLYQSWAQIFQFDTIPSIDFETEEVLFVTAYSNGCGLVLNTLTQQEDTLIVALNLPEDIRNNKDIACTEIALPNTYVMKMKKTGATKGTLTAPNTVFLENESILP